MEEIYLSKIEYLPVRNNMYQRGDCDTDFDKTIFSRFSAAEKPERDLFLFCSAEFSRSQVEMFFKTFCKIV